MPVAGATHHLTPLLANANTTAMNSRPLTIGPIPSSMIDLHEALDLGCVFALASRRSFELPSHSASRVVRASGIFLLGILVFWTESPASSLVHAAGTCPCWNEEGGDFNMVVGAIVTNPFLLYTLKCSLEYGTFEGRDGTSHAWLTCKKANGGWYAFWVDDRDGRYRLRWPPGYLYPHSRQGMLSGRYQCGVIDVDLWGNKAGQFDLHYASNYLDGILLAEHAACKENIDEAAKIFGKN